MHNVLKMKIVIEVCNTDEYVMSFVLSRKLLNHTSCYRLWERTAAVSCAVGIMKVAPAIRQQCPGQASLLMGWVVQAVGVICRERVTRSTPVMNMYLV
jgi:hypothetical protein